MSGLALGATQPTIQWVPVINQPGSEADHSLLSSASICLKGVVQRDNFTFTFTFNVCDFD